MANSITFSTALAVAATSIYLIYFICQIQRGQTPTLIDLILLEFSKHNLNRFYFILTFQMWFDLSWIEFSLLCSSCCYCCQWLFSSSLNVTLLYDDYNLLLLPAVVDGTMLGTTQLLLAVADGTTLDTIQPLPFEWYYTGYHSVSFLVVDGSTLDTTQLCLCFCFFSLLLLLLLLCWHGTTLHITRLLLLS